MGNQGITFKVVPAPGFRERGVKVPGFRGARASLNLPAHHHPPLRAEAVGDFSRPQRSQPRAQLVLGHDPEPEVLVQRPVPRDLVEGAKRQAGTGVSPRPTLGGTDKGSAKASALVLGGHAHLLDVRIAVDLVEDQVAERTVVRPHRNPRSTCVHITAKHVKRRRLVVCDRIEAKSPKGLA